MSAREFKKRTKMSSRVMNRVLPVAQARAHAHASTHTNVRNRTAAISARARPAYSTANSPPRLSTNCAGSRTGCAPSPPCAAVHSTRADTWSPSRLSDTRRRGDSARQQPGALPTPLTACAAPAAAAAAAARGAQASSGSVHWPAACTPPRRAARACTRHCIHRDTARLGDELLQLGHNPSLQPVGPGLPCLRPSGPPPPANPRGDSLGPATRTRPWSPRPPIARRRRHLRGARGPGP